MDKRPKKALQDLHHRQRQRQHRRQSHRHCQSFVGFGLP
jgi:hypothetical protein